MSEFLAPFRLPKNLLLKVEDCDGSVNSYYEAAVVTVTRAGLRPDRVTRA
ncbi:MAG: hypothetical protein RO009_13715 [Pseudorhodoplanes sp.]|nr:hypothetical protein [Pseudorhodoplanes sp.]